MKKEEKCENIELNKEAINKVQKDIVAEEIFDLAELFKLFGDSTRIKIIYAIYKRSLCVHEIASIINMIHSSVSH